MEATTYVLFFSATSSFLFLCVGIVAGWTAGQYIHEELYSVKFVDEDDLNETID